jgi:hypothetical protein
MKRRQIIIGLEDVTVDNFFTGMSRGEMFSASFYYDLGDGNGDPGKDYVSGDSFFIVITGIESMPNCKLKIKFKTKGVLPTGMKHGTYVLVFSEELVCSDERKLNKMFE